MIIWTPSRQSQTMFTCVAQGYGCMCVCVCVCVCTIQFVSLIGKYDVCDLCDVYIYVICVMYKCEHNVYV